MKRTRSISFAATVALAFGTVLGAAPADGRFSSSAQLPPCEAQPAPPPPNSTAPPAPRNLRIIKALLSGLDFDADFFSGPSAWPVEDAAAGNNAGALTLIAGPHDYYVGLASRADCLAAYSLRNQAQIEQYRKNKDRPSAVTYDFANDRDPRRQDAAKIVIPPSTNNLGTQVRVPFTLTGGSFLVTWDAWFGGEMTNQSHGIPTHKAFQISTSGDDRIYTESRVRYSLIQGNPPTVVGRTDIRFYGSANFLGPNAIKGTVFNLINYGNEALGPMVGEFVIKPETWTRYWVFFKKVGEWWELNYWVSDENTNPVRLIAGASIKPPPGEMWQKLWLEYNTSTSTVASPRPGPNNGELTSYARNVVILQGIEDITALLQRPIR